MNSVFNNFVKGMVTDVYVYNETNEIKGTGFFYAFPSKEESRVYPALIISKKLLKKGEKYVFAVPLKEDEQGVVKKHYFFVEEEALEKNELQGTGFVCMPVGSTMNLMAKDFNETPNECLSTTIEVVGSQKKEFPITAQGFCLKTKRTKDKEQKEFVVAEPVMITDEFVDERKQEIVVSLETEKNDIGCPIYMYTYGTMIEDGKVSFGRKLSIVGVVSETSNEIGEHLTKVVRFEAIYKEGLNFFEH